MAQSLFPVLEVQILVDGLKEPLLSPFRSFYRTPFLVSSSTNVLILCCSSGTGPIVRYDAADLQTACIGFLFNDRLLFTDYRNSLIDEYLFFPGMTLTKEGSHMVFKHSENNE